MAGSTECVKTYLITIPAHTFLHIKNYESNGYWDFWQKQSQIPGQDCETICRLLDSIEGKLDDDGSGAPSSGHLMAYINDPAGRMCDWGIARVECYGVRLPANYTKELPPHMLLATIPEGEYAAFEHGPFDYEQEGRNVEEQVEHAMARFDFASKGYCLDTTPGRIAYLYFDPARFLKYLRPVRKVSDQ